MDTKRDREILDHALRWAPYPGGDDQIWIDFGLTTTQFYRRLAQLLDSPASHRIDPSTLKMLHRRCRRALAEPRTHAPARTYTENPVNDLRFV